jgi:hypothetical protein
LRDRLNIRRTNRIPSYDCCIQRNPTKGIESLIIPSLPATLSIVVAFKEIPQRELRDCHSH